MARVLVSVALAACLIGGVAAIGAPPAAAQSPVKLGQLDCQIVPSTRQNFIVSSTAEVNCSFRSDVWQDEYYRGVTGVQLGVDLAIKDQELLSFLVYASPTIGQSGPISLAGKYYGAQATVAIGAGVGAFVMVGGSERQFTLAPLGGSTSQGSGVTAGIGYLYLEPAS